MKKIKKFLEDEINLTYGVDQIEEAYEKIKPYKTNDKRHSRRVESQVEPAPKK